jgi:two-component system, NtrC family, nitrogen regulation sensor histidine kinase NtrY
MVSEKLLHTDSKYIVLVSGFLLFTGAGFLFGHNLYLPGIAISFTGLIFVWLILKINDKTNEAVTVFFDSLRNDDTTLHFPESGKNKSLARLYDSMNSLNTHFQEIRLRNEYNETYYKTLIHHASAGLLVLNSNNRIEVINKAACMYAGISPDSTNPDLLRIKHPAFFDAICRLKPGENVTYRNLHSNNLQLLFFRATTIRRQDIALKLVSIQDIRYELESKELESYRKLMNVMTHEIMNLLSPLTSASRELYSMFSTNDLPKKLSQIDESTIKIAVNGLQLIDEQSNGLMNFVNSYRKISKIPHPEFSTFDVDDWIGQLKIAFMDKMKSNKIAFDIISDKSLRQIIADKKLLNQVMINLINNSFDAVMEIEKARKISIHIMKDIQNRVIIRISNNGPLIPVALQEKIFVPFFTTKKNGSGIGLSISQEIMKLHNGSLVVVSTEVNGTSFILEF